MSEPIQLVRRDQTRLKQIRAWWPVGTPEDLARHGLDPAEFGSCAPKDPKNGMLGCAAYDICPLVKNGVKRFGVRFIKSAQKGGTMRVVGTECYTAVLLANQAEADGNGDLVEVVAQEGETIRTMISVPVKDSLGRITSYTAEPTDMVIVPFPKISENKELLEYALAGAERKRHEEERAADARERAISSAGAVNLLAGGTESSRPQKPERK